MLRRKISLCGMWQYSANGGAYEEKEVPFSALCVGESQCRLLFSAPKRPGRTLLCFEGINYDGQVWFNGTELGTTLPYCRYEFDVTHLLSEQENEIVVRMKDIGSVFLSEGWESYSGIVREVYLLQVPENYLEDVFWYVELAEDHRSAVCHADLTIAGTAASARAELLRDGQVISQCSDNSMKLCWRMEQPLLWSLDHPNLYTLRVSLLAQDGSVLDRVEKRVGFKSFRVDGNRFVLNGEPVFLRGVCRHDMFGHNYGHTVPTELLRRDLQMIKDTGANFVRLVHYPHDRRVLDLADEIGLLVSGEPGINGLFGLKHSSLIWEQPVVEPGLEVLRRMILRDRSHVSVAFWLVYNECVVPVEFIRMTAQLCKGLDPTRPVSGTSCMMPELTKERFSEGGYDFYTHHPYGKEIDAVCAGFPDDAYIDWDHLNSLTLGKLLNILDDKPLVFTEWGGLHVFSKPERFERFLDFMIQAWRSTERGTVLAGMSYWSWADIYELNRGFPDCQNGILTEGLVDVDRNPRENMEIFARKMSQFDTSSHQRKQKPVDLAPWQNAEENQIAYHTALEQARYVSGWILHKQYRQYVHGPILSRAYNSLQDVRVDLNTELPITVGHQRKTVQIPLEGICRELRIYGNVCLCGGFPISGRSGETVARYVLVYQDGSEQTILLRHGLELTTVFSTHLASRIDARAINAPKVLRWHYDKNWEQYSINCFTIYPEQGKTLQALRIEILKDDTDLLTYGITQFE